jgi:MoxR-like ATPase
MTDQNTAAAAETLKKVLDNIEKVMKGQSESIRLLLAGFAGGGHILCWRIIRAPARPPWPRPWPFP